MKKILVVLLLAVMSVPAYARMQNERNGKPAVMQTKVFSAGAASDTTIDVSSSPLSLFSLQAGETLGAGLTVGSWDIRLEGSNDNSHFTQILQHVTTTNAPDANVTSGTAHTPYPFVRLRLASIAANSTVTARFTGI